MEQWKSIVEEVDQDGDGEIDFKEFKQAILKTLELTDPKLAEKVGKGGNKIKVKGQNKKGGKGKKGKKNKKAAAV